MSPTASAGRARFDLDYPIDLMSRATANWLLEMITTMENAMVGCFEESPPPPILPHDARNGGANPSRR